MHLGMASLATAGGAGTGIFSPEDRLAFFEGIKKYQAHHYKRDMPGLINRWQLGGATLSALPDQSGPPVVLVPSMINRSDILDLMPQRSLVRWLAGHGHNTHLFDWGNPAVDPGQSDFEQALQRRLVPALKELQQPAVLIGYCMGGLFALAAAALYPDLVRGVVLLATPWNFHDEAGALRARLSLMQPLAMPFMAQYNRLPESWMQATFATLDPESSVRKFAAFARMAPENPGVEMFVAVEDWLNNGVDLPAGIARTCFDEWYRDNDPYNECWKVGGQTVSAGAIKARTCVIAARQDKIVPLDSALAFASQRAKCDTIICDTGHIGLLTGRNAPAEIWPRLSDWLTGQQ